VYFHNFAFGGRYHFDSLSISIETKYFLSLPYPLARPRQFDPLHWTHQGRGKLVRADPEHTLPLLCQPSVPSVIAKAFGDQKPIHHLTTLISRYRGSNFYRDGRHGLVAIQKIVQHHERQKRDQNQNDCHIHPSFPLVIRAFGTPGSGEIYLFI